MGERQQHGIGGMLQERSGVVWMGGHTCKGIRRGDLLHMVDELLLVLHLQDTGELLPIPQLEKMSLKLLPLATK
jgi:hypothetical protein